ncbi:MAG: carbohydrate ABC transporter substrate-binding protein [Oscillospiraceae bacterium]|nr:carbohydrate ABC transporter substrate-binding protein [Oscillospiraceae bacterium]
MKNKLQNLAIILLIVVAIIVVCLLGFVLPKSAEEAESQNPQTTIELVFPYQNSQWTSCIEDIITSFEAARPDIDIKYEILYEDTVYEDILSKKTARNELGDIVQLKEPYAWAETGLIAPLPFRFGESVDFVCSVDDEIYAVCALGSTTGIVYNKAIFDSLGLTPPSTYNEFLKICSVLRSKGITPLGVGGKDLWHLEYWLNHFLRADVLSAEPDFLALCSSGERDWSDPLICNMLRHMNELFALGYVDPQWANTTDSSLAYKMSEGEVAMVFSGPWLASSALALENSMDLGWFYVPNTDGNAIAGESLDVFWAVTAQCAQNSAKKEAAIAFLDHFYSEGAYENLCTEMGSFSTLRDPQRSATPDEGILAEVMEDNAKADIHISDYVGDENTPPGFEKKLLLLLYDMCTGKLSPEEAQDLACLYWDECRAREVAYEN